MDGLQKECSRCHTSVWKKDVCASCRQVMKYPYFGIYDGTYHIARAEVSKVAGRSVIPDVEEAMEAIMDLSFLVSSVTPMSMADSDGRPITGTLDTTRMTCGTCGRIREKGSGCTGSKCSGDPGVRIFVAQTSLHEPMWKYMTKMVKVADPSLTGGAGTRLMEILAGMTPMDISINWAYRKGPINIRVVHD